MPQQTTFTANHRLASYGTLAPGRSNHAQVEHLSGRWIKGTVRGTATTNTTGRWTGYPGFHLHADGEPVSVFILESSDLTDHWDRLDVFEGEAYARVVTTAQTDEGPLQVCVYELRRPLDSSC
ncbi:MAG: gamma-glutamylcyclotransferase [Devosiaceae bacterium]